jgi:hypothetical protein
MFRSFLGVVVLLAAACGAAAQSTDSAQQPPAPPAAQAASPATPGSPTPGADSIAKKPKKVWTNEDLPEAHGTGAGDAKIAVKAHAQSGKPADPVYVANVRKQLEKLQGQLADADKQIAKLKEFNAGEPVGTGERQLHKGYNMEPVDQQIQALEKKKAETQAKVEVLLDEARKKGVEPGQLR